MRVIISGVRYATSPGLIERAIADSGFEVTHVIHGAYKGVDLLAEDWAKRNEIPYTGVPAKWKEAGNSAGPIRNQQMATRYQAEALIAIWDGESRGTEGMIRQAKFAGLQIYIHTVAKAEASAPPIRSVASRSGSSSR